MNSLAGGFLKLVPFVVTGLFAEEPRLLQSIESFEDTAEGAPRGIRPISYWRWSDSDKTKASTYSQLERFRLPEGAGKQALKITIPQSLPEGLDFYALWSTGLDYLPPEATAIRMKVRVVSGRFTLSVGGPTTYFATSDVRARPQVLEPNPNENGWQNVTFSLISDLERNYRRPIFSSDSPVIYYTRWIQEPMRLLVGADTQGELWLDEIELIGTGEGLPFPADDPVGVRPLAKADLGAAFTFATDDREFDLSHTPGEKPLREPALLRRTPGGLEVTQRGLEEMSFFGVPANCPDGANALRLTLTMNHDGPFDELALDVLALVAPDGDFPWDQTVSSQPLAGGFDYGLSPRRTEGLSWGFYHARRAVSEGKKVTLLIPFSDFVCAYGSGALRDRHRLQQSLAASEMMAVALVSPFRQGRAETHFLIESIEAVAMPPTSDSGVYYPQVRDLSRIRLEPVPGEHGRQTRQVEVK